MASSSSSTSMFPPESVRQDANFNEFPDPASNPLIMRDNSTSSNSISSINTIPLTLPIADEFIRLSSSPSLETMAGGGMSDDGGGALTKDPVQPKVGVIVCPPAPSPAPAKSTTTTTTTKPGAKVGRGNYKCGRCGVPKKGHKCPYKPKRKKDPNEMPPETKTIATQCDIGEKKLEGSDWLKRQGTMESYNLEGSKRLKVDR
mmetsp:Transcript_5481/g.10974  ORF Transcript_5481/g.10974 Transcript_5481/m.10974 type:complete len:202 (-) Transcript_5481:99-704(-)